MKLGLTFTVHSKEDSEEFLLEANRQLIQLMKKVYKEKEYSIIKLVVGLHTQASRLHTHIFHIIEVDESKEVKHWNKKLQGMFKSKDDKIELRMTIYRETDPLYNEYKGLSYPLKEYEKYEDIKMTEEFINMTPEQIESHREDAHNLYLKSKAEHQRNEERKRQEEDETTQIFVYITNYIDPKSRKITYQFHACDFRMKLTLVGQGILEYYRERAVNTGRKKFKAYDIKNIAISYLTIEKLVELHEITNYLL